MNQPLINWIEDQPAMAIADKLGLLHVVIDMEVNEIDRGRSSENRARDIPLNEGRLDGIRHSYATSIPMPMIFVRVTSQHNVIAGGNHRFNSLPDYVTQIKVHAVECTDAEFEIFCRALNTVVGEGMTHQERIRSSVDAVLRLGLTRVAAREIYGLSKAEVDNAVKREVAKQRILSLVPSAGGKLLNSHLLKLSELGNNDNVLKAATTLLVKSNMSGHQFADIVSQAKAKTTESEQIAVFASATSAYQKGKTISVPKLARKNFVTALTKIETLMDKKTWQALEIDAMDIPSIKKRVEQIEDYLNCLCRANG